MAQIQFEAKVGKTSFELNEKLLIHFVMNKDGRDFKAPTFKGFEVIKELEQVESRTWKKDKMIAYEKTYSYILLPLKKGNLRIKKAIVTYDGKVYKTTPLKINVTASSEE